MPNTREKLVELQRACCTASKPCQSDCFVCMADHLIANNVVPVVRCKDCDWYRKHEGGICVNPKCVKSWYGCPVSAEHFCSYGERRHDE